MPFSGTDWISLWRIYYPTFFEIYIVLIVPAMFFCSRRIVSKRSTLVALVLSVVSLIVVVRFPIGAIIWMIIEALTFGDRGRYSFWNGVPFAIFMALFGALACAGAIRFVFKERVGRKNFALLYTCNFLAVALAITFILVLAFTWPPEVIA
jgi:hypothetical protein